MTIRNPRGPWQHTVGRHWDLRGIVLVLFTLLCGCHPASDSADSAWRVDRTAAESPNQPRGAKAGAGKLAGGELTNSGKTKSNRRQAGRFESMSIPADFPETAQDVLDEGRALARQLVDTLDRSNEALNLQAHFELRFGNPEVAQESWKTILSREPNHVAALEGMGELCTLQGQLSAAVTYYRRAAGAEPDNPARQLMLGLSLVEAAELGQAKKVLGSVLDTHPDYAEAHVELACVLLQLDEFEDAREHLEKALDLAPNQRSVHLGLAKVYARSGQREQAKVHFEKHRELQATYDRQREVGRRTYDDKEQNLKVLAQLYTDAAEIYVGRQTTSVAQGLLRRAAELDTGNIDCRQKLSWLAAQAGDVDSAISWLEEISEMHPEQFIVVRDLARLEAGAGRIDRAEARLQAFINDHPEHIEALMGLAQFYLSLPSGAARAVDCCQRIVQLKPVAESYALLASACEANGQVMAAVRALDQAISLEPDNARFRQALIILRSRVNQETSPGRP